MAFARERSGIGGRQTQNDVIADFPGAEVRFGDVSDPASLVANAFDQPTDVVVSCLASRTGGRKDSWAIDHQATLNTYLKGREAGVAHYVLLSAICVQKPLLEFQKAKLAFEAALQADGEMTHSIVRPTAFFKSLGGQVESCRKGGPYVMFGGGTMTSCKPISEADLARFMADCLRDDDKINQVLPIWWPWPSPDGARAGGDVVPSPGPHTADAVGTDRADGWPDCSDGWPVQNLSRTSRHNRIRTDRAVLRQ